MAIMKLLRLVLSQLVSIRRLSAGATSLPILVSSIVSSDQEDGAGFSVKFQAHEQKLDASSVCLLFQFACNSLLIGWMMRIVAYHDACDALHRHGGDVLPSDEHGSCA